MVYKITLTNRAIKSLENISEPYYNNIKQAILKLADNPRPQGFKKLKGRKGAYRIRIANYRVIYEIIDNILRINIIEIGHRRDVYS